MLLLNVSDATVKVNPTDFHRSHTVIDISVDVRDDAKQCEKRLNRCLLDTFSFKLQVLSFLRVPDEIGVIYRTTVGKVFY